MKRLLILIALIVILAFIFWDVTKWILVAVGLYYLLQMFLHLIPIISSGSYSYLHWKPILFGLMGAFPAIYWCFIPYWEICQWFLFGLLVITCAVFHFYYYCPIILQKILLGGTFIWTGFLATKYLFIPYWSVFAVILQVIIVVVSLIILYSILKVVYDNLVATRRKKLTEKLKQNVEGLPIPDNAVFDNDSESLAKKAIKQFAYLYYKIETASDERDIQKYRQQLFEQKLYTFYEISLRAESDYNYYAYSQFETQYNEAISANDIRKLRYDLEENTILNKKQTYADRFIEKMKDVLTNDIKKDYDSRISSIQNSDVSGLWGLKSTEKLRNQTLAFENLQKRAIDELNKFKETLDEVNNELTRIRLTAYRNTYLTTEIVNYLKNKSKGRNIKTEKGVFGIDNSYLQDIDVNVDVTLLTTDYSKMMDSANTTFQKSINTLQGFGFKPGKRMAIGVGLFSIGWAVFEEHMREVEENRKAQDMIISNINRIIDELVDGRRKLNRTVVLMGKIAKANNDCYYMYADLRNKVFYSDAIVSEEDIDKLYEMTKVYNKVSTEEL